MTETAKPKEMTKEEQEAFAKDLEVRVKGFNEKMIPLLKEFKLGLGASAFLLPDGRIAARPQLFDDSKSFEKSEAPAEEKKAEGSLESSAS